MEGELKDLYEKTVRIWYREPQRISTGVRRTYGIQGTVEHDARNFIRLNNANHILASKPNPEKMELSEQVPFYLIPKRNVDGIEPSS